MVYICPLVFYAVSSLFEFGRSPPYICLSRAAVLKPNPNLNPTEMGADVMGVIIVRGDCP